MKEPTRSEVSLDELNAMIDSLGDPSLSTDGVVDLTFELASLAQKAQVELELSGRREEAAGLYDRLAGALKEAAAHRPEDERALVESVAEFWELTARSWQSAAQPPATVEMEPSKPDRGRQIDHAARLRERLRPRPIKPPVQPSVASTESLGPRVKPGTTTWQPRAHREVVAQRPGDQQRWLDAVRASDQFRVSDMTTSRTPFGEPSRPTVSKDVARLRQRLATRTPK